MVILIKVASSSNQFTTPSFPHPNWGLWTTAHNFQTSTHVLVLRELSVNQQPASTRTVYFMLCLSVTVWRYIYIPRRCGPYSGHGPLIFLPVILFGATDFRFRIWSRETASFCILSSHLLRGLPTDLFPPLRCSILPFFNVNSTLESTYPNMCWKGYIAIHCFWISTLLWMGSSEYLSEDSSFKGTDFVNWLLGKSPYFNTIKQSVVFLELSN